MEINGDSVIFTPSEARWVQENCRNVLDTLGLAQRVLDSRRNFARDWLNDDPALDVGVPGLNSTPADYMDFMQASEIIHETTVQHTGVDETGQEPHVIPVEIDEYEKHVLWSVAALGNLAAVKELNSHGALAIELSAEADSIALRMLSSDTFDQERADKLINAIRDPETKATYVEEERDKLQHLASVTGQITTALVADLTSS